MKSQQSFIKRYAPLIIVIVVLLLAVAVVTPTLAYYLIKADKAETDYTPATSNNPIISLTAGDSVSDVGIKVEDKGYPVYVRVTIVINWQSSDGTVYFAPSNDYSLTTNNSDWEQIGDYYYFKHSVASGGTTAALITEFTTSSTDVPEGYVLKIELIAQTVQAIGSTDNNGTPAWKDAWDIGPSTWN